MCINEIVTQKLSYLKHSKVFPGDVLRKLSLHVEKRNSDPKHFQVSCINHIKVFTCTWDYNSPDNSMGLGERSKFALYVSLPWNFLELYNKENG